MDNFSDAPCDAWIEDGYLPGTIPFVLKHDAIDSLKQLVFDKDDRIPPSLFAQCPIVQHNPTLLQFSAFFGAVKCFGWLLELGADVNAHDECFPSISVMQFAIAGGNTTVIRELTRRQVPLVGGLQIAARYFRNDFFESLAEKCNVRENHVDYATMLHQSCAANNLGGLSFCFDNGSEVEARDETDKTPLHYAAIEGSVDCGRVLISQEDVDMNARDRVFFLFLME
jgi:ankyrin repeat protein